MADGQTNQTPLPQTSDPSLPRTAEAFQAQKEGEAQYLENFGSPLEQAYGKAKSWLSEHEGKLDEKYLKPFRTGLDNMADDLQNAAESGHTKSGGQLTGPTQALAEGAAAGLRMVPIGKTVKETVGANAIPMDLGGEENLAKKLVEGEGLVYKGEVSPGTGIHMIEHPDLPGKTSTFKSAEGMTPENVHKNMERKFKEFGKTDYTKPNENKTVYRARPVGEEGLKATDHPIATDSKAKAEQYKKDLEGMNGRPHEVVEIPLKGTTHTAHPHPTNEGETWYKFQKDVPESQIKAPKKDVKPSKISEKGKGFDDQKFPKSYQVEVTWPDHPNEAPHFDEVKGLNENHALSRAKGNWEGANVKIVKETTPSGSQADKDLKVYDVMDKDGTTMSTHYSAKDARRKADRLDTGYGGVRYRVQERSPRIPSERSKAASKAANEKGSKEL